MGTVEHKTCDLLDSHLRCQILGTLLHGLTPILVDIHLAVAVQILERITALGENLHT